MALYQDPGTDTATAGQSSGFANPWWTQPAPPGYSGPWPPPLPPGASYGPDPGSILYASAPGGATPPTGTGQYYWDPNANGGAGGYSQAGLTPVPSAPGMTQFSGLPGSSTTTTPPPSGGGGSTGTGLPNPFGISPFTPPQWLSLPTVPTFTPPPAPNLQPFQAPTREEALAEPGGQFAISQGLGAISNDAAARGLWGTGATGKAMNDYARNAADALYGNIYNRDLSTYLANNNALLQGYGARFQNASAAFNPLMTAYSTESNATANRNALNLNTALSAWNDLFNQRLGSGQFLQGASR